MKRRLYAALGCALLAAACSPADPPVAPQTESIASAPPVDTHDHHALPGRVYHWTCDDGSAVQMDNLIERDAIVLHLPEGMVTLPHLESASGARYGNEEIVFWTHDSEQALFERRPAQATRCVISAVE